MKKNYLKGEVLVDFRRFTNIRELLRYYVAEYRERPIYMYKEGEDRHDVYKSFLNFEADINAFGEALMRRAEIDTSFTEEPQLEFNGKNPYNSHEGKPIGRRREALAVIGENSYPWVVAYAAYLFGLGVAVPLDRDLEPREALGLAQRAEISVLAYGANKSEIAMEIAANCPSLRCLVALEGEAGENLQFTNPDGSVREVQQLAYQDLIKEGEAILEAGSTEFYSLEIRPHDLAAIFFTSGTTSSAKGVMLSNFNIASDLWAGQSVINLQPVKRALSVLPLHHTFENIVVQMALWQRGVTICFNDRLRYLAKNMVEWEIDIIFMVPLILESIQKKLLTGIEKKGKTKLFKFLLKFSKFLRKIGIDKRDKLFKQIRDGVSPHLKVFFLGGAALDPAVQEFFLDLGYDIWNAWGLTEAAPGITAGNIETVPIGSVGRVKAGDELWLEDLRETADGKEIGELIVRSDSVMIGYYRDPERTAEVLLPDHTLKTGDLGYFEGNAVFLSGREKSMIVLGNGKNIFPEEIERQLDEEISELAAVMVWPETNHRGQVELAARLQIDPEYLEQESSLKGAELTAKLAEQIQKVNHLMPAYKAIKHFFWSGEPLLMTTTRKVKRQAEVARVREALASRELDPLKADNGQISLEGENNGR